MMTTRHCNRCILESAIKLKLKVHGSKNRFLRVFIGLALACVVSACENTLIFAERTGFNLAIQVNDDPATPVQVNAGLKRTVVGLVPPSKTAANGNNGSRADGEAVSMFSGFRLEYDKAETSVFQGDLTIRTQFASGMAARTIATDDNTGKAVSKIVNVRKVTHTNSESVQRIRAWLRVNRDNAVRLRDWVTKYAPEISLADLAKGSKHEAKRAAAIEDLGIP